MESATELTINCVKTVRTSILIQQQISPDLDNDVGISAITTEESGHAWRGIAANFRYGTGVRSSRIRSIQSDGLPTC
jgi:hypothetical protein